MISVHFEMRMMQILWILRMEKHKRAVLIFTELNHLQLCTLYNTLMICHCALP